MKSRSEPMTTTGAACWAGALGAILVLAITVPALIALLNYRPSGPEDLVGAALAILTAWPMLILESSATMLATHGFLNPWKLTGVIDSPHAKSTDLCLLVAFNAASGVACGFLFYFTYRLLRSGITHIRRFKA